MTKLRPILCLSIVLLIRITNAIFTNYNKLSTIKLMKLLQYKGLLVNVRFTKVGIYS